MRVFLL